jgi:hypothetical protein
MRRLLITLGALCVLGSSFFFAGARAATQAETWPPIEDLAFMAGHWQGEIFGGKGEEAWLGPAGGTMLGVFRLVHDGKTSVTEYLMITEEEDGIVFRFKHFDPDYRAWEEEDPLTFHLVDHEKGRAALFECPVEQSPKRMTYRLREDGKLSILLESEEDGKTETVEAVFHPKED